MKNVTLDTEVQQEKMTGCRGFFILGFPNALLSFSLALTGIVFSELVVYRTCLVLRNSNQTECNMLRTNSGSPEAIRLEAEVEPYASMILMAKSLFESILPTMLSLFIGPWSDRNGRRPVMLAGLTGFVIMFASHSLMCNWNISPWFMLLPSIPAFIMGGMTTVTLASNCYISDTTVEKDRTVFLAWLQTSIFSGIVFGIFAGPYLYKNYGYTAVFCIATMCVTCALLHSYFFVLESVKDVSKESLHKLFKISFLKEIVTSCLFKRDGFYRPVIWLAIFISTMWGMILQGDVNIAFLFTRTRLGWDVQQYSYLSGTGVVLTISGLCGVSLISPILGVSDTVLAGIGLMSGMCSELTKSLAWQGWHMYLATVIGTFNGIISPVMRSIISKSIRAEDVGKVFSLMALLETLSPLGGAPLLTLVYSSFMPPIYPSPAFLVTTALFLVSILCLVCIEVLVRKSHEMHYIPAAQDDIKS